MTLCRKGLHPKDYSGYCRPCKRIRQARYAKTEKRREQMRRYQRTYYYESMSGLVYQWRLLQSRRCKALKERERRNSGALQD